MIYASVEYCGVMSWNINDRRKQKLNYGECILITKLKHDNLVDILIKFHCISHTHDKTIQQAEDCSNFLMFSFLLNCLTLNLHYATLKEI